MTKKYNLSFVLLGVTSMIPPDASINILLKIEKYKKEKAGSASALLFQIYFAFLFLFGFGCF